jgi:acyl-CoA thioesterase II
MTATDLVTMLHLDEAAPHRYVGKHLPGSSGVVYGGQLLAQSISAAVKSQGTDMLVKSMHTLFTRAGSADRPMTFDVELLHAGRSFASVEVSVHQEERLCTRSLVLFHRPDPDLIRYNEEAPLAPAPGQCVSRPSPRPGWDVSVPEDVDLSDPEAVGPPEFLVWSRFGQAPDDEWASQALLAYASDGFLIGTAMRPHPGVGQSMAHVSIATTVIRHTLTFHDAFHAGDWLLLAHRSPHAGGGRSYGRADVFTETGCLVASYEQENMIRALAQ